MYVLWTLMKKGINLENKTNGKNINLFAFKIIGAYF